MAFGMCVGLTACGGGKGTTGSSDATAQAASMPTSDAEAYRFLTQASFGPTPAQAAHVRAIGYSAWIDEQFAAPVSSTHLATVQASAAALHRSYPMADDVARSWWTHAIADDGAQLRHRVAFALSEIFVVSTSSLDRGDMVASYLDMLTQHADGNYRDLLEAVALHPAMGQFLSHRGNQKEDGKGRVPDENFAREVMQLFSIGLYELDDSGQPSLVNGQPVETYGTADVQGLAKVFTGFSWNKLNTTGLAWWVCFWRGPACQNDTQFVLPMEAYPEAHSTSEKRFLGVTIPAQETAAPATSLKMALDRLASHHNTAPFISKQLIQRLVTSNPSDQYVSDITRVFRQSNGNLKSVVKAILLHSEARQVPSTGSAAFSGYGKLREPLLRATHLLRALPHASAQYTAGGAAPFYFAIDTSDPGTALGQSPMRSPSVFNFFRPGYKAPQSRTAAANLVAPEMQITNETSVLGYANFVGNMLDQGWGQWNSTRQQLDVQFDYSAWTSMASTPTTLIDAIARQLLGQVLPEARRSLAIEALQAMPKSSATQIRRCVEAAILLVATSPDFVVQQ